MLRWLNARVLVLAVLFALTGCANCTDGAATNVETNNRPDPETEVPAGSRLEHVAEEPDPCNPTQPICAKNVTFSSNIPLKVRLVDGEGNPIDNTSINFELDAGTAMGTTLEAASGVTDPSGFADTKIRAASTAGTAEVIVTAGGTESGVEPIKFVVAVNSKGRSSYVVVFEHNGTSQLENIQVLAHASDTSCAQVREDHERAVTPGVNPVLTAVTTNSGIAGADGTLPQVVIPNVPNGTAYTIEARAHSRPNPEVEAAFGCADGNPPVENGMSQEVLVTLTDNLPVLKGTYDVTHVFSIQDAVCGYNPDTGEYMGVLPSGVCTAIDLIGRLATDPGSFLVGDDMGNRGLVQILIDFLPDGGLKDSISALIENDFIQQVARDVINDFAEDWINENAPDWARNAINITGDIYESLNEFKVNGTIRILEEPRPAVDDATGAVIGILEANEDGEKPGVHVWNEVIVFWTGDCDPGMGEEAFEACRQRPFSANDVGTMGVVEGTFDGSMVPIEGDDPGYGLVINEHTLTLNYGVFILGILEKIILPSVFGDQSIDSLGDALEKLIEGIFGGDNGCDGFGMWVDQQVGGGADIAESACNSLIARGAEAVRDFMTESLTVSGEDNFLIGTPDDEPCRLHEPDSYAGEWTVKPLPYVERMGENRPELECKWNLKIKYGDGPDGIVETTGTFWGDRSGF